MVKGQGLWQLKSSSLLLKVTVHVEDQLRPNAQGSQIMKVQMSKSLEHKSDGKVTAGKKNNTQGLLFKIKGEEYVRV